MSTVAASTVSRPDPPQLVEDLIFDVGMHRGEDTAYYLRKGFRVVAFEANPELVRTARERFAAEIADRRLEIVSGAITDQARDSVTFYIHSRMSTWGTAVPARAGRNEVMGPSAEITVPAVDFVSCLRDGVPYYLKIDIEAGDMLCLEALLDVEPRQRPRYTSIEAESETWSGVVRQFELLERLGYSRFATVQQARTGEQSARITTHDGRTVPYRFEMYSSGPFGDDLAVAWLEKSEAMRRYRWLLLALRAGNRFDRLVPKGPEIRFLMGALVRRPLPGWFDIHAAR
jgi:FkbM family methyltransferase